VRFQFGALQRRQGQRGIIFSQYDDFARKLSGKKQEVCFTLPENVLEWMEATEERERVTQRGGEEKDIRDGLDSGSYHYAYMTSGPYLINECICIIRHATEEEKQEYREEYRDGLCGLIRTIQEGKIENRSQTAKRIWKESDRKLHFFGGESSGIILDHEDAKQILSEVEIETDRKRKEIEEKNQKYRDEFRKLREEKLREAKESGRNVTIRKVGSYDGDEEFPGEERGMVIVYEVATPAGEIITKECDCA